MVKRSRELFPGDRVEGADRVCGTVLAVARAFCALYGATYTVTVLWVQNGSPSLQQYRSGPEMKWFTLA